MNERENCLRMFRRQGPEWVPCEYSSIQLIVPSCMRDRADDDGYDYFGVKWKDQVRDPEFCLLPDITKWKEYIKFPDIGAMDWESLARVECAALDRKGRVIWLQARLGPFERMLSFMGFEQTLTNMYTEPEALKELIDAYIDWRVGILHKAIACYDPDAVSIHDDYGTQLSLFMSRDMWCDFFKDGLKKLFDAIHEHGKIAILHSCGHIDPLIGDFVEIGVDCWDSVQSCCNLPEIYKKYGRQLSFTPSLNMQVLFAGSATPDMARRMVRDTVDMLGRFGNVMIRDTPPARFEYPEIIAAIRDECDTYGRDYYKHHPIPAK